MIKNKFIQRIVDKGIERLLTLSGAVTSIIILFICLFLFIEGFGLFKSKTIEDGYGLYVHSKNPINELNPEEMKRIFDAEITNWNQLGGTNTTIRVFRIEEVFQTHSEDELGEDYSMLTQLLGDVIKSDSTIIAFL